MPHPTLEQVGVRWNSFTCKFCCSSPNPNLPNCQIERSFALGPQAVSQLGAALPQGQELLQGLELLCLARRRRERKMGISSVFRERSRGRYLARGIQSWNKATVLPHQPRPKAAPVRIARPCPDPAPLRDIDLLYMYC